MSIRRLCEGERVDALGVAFTFHMSIPDLVRGTTGPDGFAWKWLLLGRVFENGPGGVKAYDSGALIGEDGDNVHVIGLPEKGASIPYLSGPVTNLEVEATYGGLSGKKVKGIKLAWEPEFGMAAFRVDVVVPGSASVRSKGEVAFCERFARRTRAAAPPPGSTVGVVAPAPVPSTDPPAAAAAPAPLPDVPAGWYPQANGDLH